MVTTENPNQLRCVQPGCTFDTDGKCLEGIPKGEGCPHRVSSAQQAPQADDGDSPRVEDTVPTDWLGLPDGYELSITAAQRITVATEPAIVVLAGEPDSGKTTLLAALFEKFSEGAYCDFRFAGSETLLAFERACFLSRTSSGRDEPDTERTKGTAPRFFHLLLQRVSEPSCADDLMIADVSGEAYKRALNTSADASLLEFVKRGDRFVLLLDGKRLQSKELRQDVFHRAKLLLRSLGEANVLTKRSSVRVAVSKFDLLQPEVCDANTREFVEYVRIELERFGKERFDDFAVIEIASRPQTGSELPYAYGIDRLLNEWMNKIAVPYVAPTFPRPHTDLREAELYLWRTSQIR